MNDVQTLRRAVNALLIPYLWLHLPLFALVGWVTGAAWLGVVGAAAAINLAATVLWRLDPDGFGTRGSAGVALIAMVSLLVFQFAGHPWQIDQHMYFFAALAMLTAYCDWRVIVAAAGVTALHHLVLNFALPYAVFPQGASFGRVLVHAVMVVIETAVLAWIAWRLVQAFGRSEAALAEALEARGTTERMAREKAELEQRAAEQKRAELAALAGRFESEIGAIVQGLGDATRVTRTAAERFAHDLDATSRDADGVNESASDAAKDVGIVATATHTLVQSIGEITERIAQASSLVRDTVASAETTDRTVGALSTAADQIGSVVALIQEIAGKTNLLALNATIEAARAGDAGKGFAVVASEVKSLATQTAKATEEISSQIASIRSVSDEAVEAIRRILESVRAIDGSIRTASGTVEQQNTMVGQIADATRSASGRTEQVSTGIRHLSERAGDMVRQSATALDAAATLDRQAVQLRSGVDGFLARVRG